MSVSLTLDVPSTVPGPQPPRGIGREGRDQEDGSRVPYTRVDGVTDGVRVEKDLGRGPASGSVGSVLWVFLLHPGLSTPDLSPNSTPDTSRGTPSVALRPRPDPLRSRRPLSRGVQSRTDDSGED